jgi:hypothetical protein
VAGRHLGRSRAQVIVRPEADRVISSTGLVRRAIKAVTTAYSTRSLTRSVLHLLRSANDTAAVWPGKKGSDHSHGNLIEAKPREIVVLPYLSAVERERLLFG